MPMDQSKQDELNALITSTLDSAEAIWKKSVPFIQLQESSKFRAFTKSMSTQIPGYPLIEEDFSAVDTFIAMVVDIRDSSKHLISAISERVTLVNQLERVFYETSALLPAAAKTITSSGGSVTEYLGDGLLALFPVKKNETEAVILTCYRVSNSIVSDVRDIVNTLLNQRYKLPPLDIGVGLSLSKAIVMAVGTSEFRQPKVIGECVYRATKLSSGKNEIHIDDEIKLRWPSTKNGTLRFEPTNSRGVTGYRIRVAS